MAEGITKEEQLLFRQVMGRFATGITVITAQENGRILGMTANAFMAGSLIPPLCMVCINRTAQMHACLERTSRYAVSFLREDQQHLSDHFANRPDAKFNPEFVELDGMPVLARCVGSLCADVTAQTDCGDHSLFIGKISRMQSGSGMPLLFFSGRYGTVDRDQMITESVPPSFW